MMAVVQAVRSAVKFSRQSTWAMEETSGGDCAWVMLLSTARGPRNGSRDILIFGCDDAVLLEGFLGPLGFVGCKKEDQG